jgi:hypothetical protein
MEHINRRCKGKGATAGGRRKARPRTHRNCPKAVNPLPCTPPEKEVAMGMHNLDSRSLADLMDELAGELDVSQSHPWIDSVLSQWGSSAAPGSSYAEALGHVLAGLRGLKFHFARRAYLAEAELLNAVIERNAQHPRSIYIEYVDSPSMDDALSRYTVWKGVLFDTLLDRTVVCWHPDKDFNPAGAGRVYRTGHSALGRRKRRREASRRAREGR